MELCENSVESILNNYIESTPSPKCNNRHSCMSVEYPFTLYDIHEMSRDIMKALEFLHRYVKYVVLNWHLNCIQ